MASCTKPSRRSSALRSTLGISTLSARTSLRALPGAKTPTGETFCHDRNDIIRRLKQLLDSGVRATIALETATGPRGIAAQIEVEWPKADLVRPDRISYSQVYVVIDGLVTEIHGHDDMDSALAAVSH